MVAAAPEPGSLSASSGIARGHAYLILDQWSRHEQWTLVIAVVLVALVVYLALRQRDRRRRQHIAALERLGDIALAIASVPGQELRPVLDRLAGAARDLLRMPMSRVLLVDEANPRLIRVAHDYGLTAADPEARPRTEYSLDESPVTDECLRTGKVLLIADTRRDPHGMNPSLVEAFGVRALAVTPLRAAGKSIGVLLLADHRPRRISEAERGLIELWGAQAAVSIVNNRLYQQMDEAIRSLRQIQAQRDTLYQMSTAVQASKTPQEALTRVADLAPTALGMDVCIVCLRDHSHTDARAPEARAADTQMAVAQTGDTHTGDSRAAAADTVNADAIRIAAITRLPYAFPLSAGMTLRSIRAAQAMRKRRPVALEDASQDADLCELGLPFSGSALYVPLTGKASKSIGALVLLRRQSGAFSDATIRLAEMFSLRAATSIENAELHEQARRDADAKATLLHELNHRVKNNLAGLVGLLSMGTPEMSAEAQRWLERVIERISAMARAHELFSAGQEVRLRELIHTMIDSVAAVKSEHVHVSVDLTDSGQVILPADVAVPLAMVVYELAYNGLVHGAGEAGRLQVRATRRGNEMCIEVIDDGGQSVELVGATAGNTVDTSAAPSGAVIGRARGAGGVAGGVAGAGAVAGSGAGSRRGGVGLSLVRGLVSRELRGSFTLRPGDQGGTVAAVSFPLEGDLGGEHV